MLGGKIDFCHIDGDHSYDSVLADLSAVKEYMACDSYILLHDACWLDVKNAIDEFLRTNPEEIVDCGLVDPFPNEEGLGGMRLLRVVPRKKQKWLRLLEFLHTYK